MEKAIIFIGVQEDSTEIYQLVLENSYHSASYSPQETKNREETLTDIAETFGRRIMDRRKSYQIILGNGKKLTLDPVRVLKVGKLEKDTLDFFGQKLKEAMKNFAEGKAAVVQADGLN